MDRDAMARAARRREVLEALAFEQEREAALRDQIEAVVLEEEGPRIDRGAQALLTPAERDLLDDFFVTPLEEDDVLDDTFLDEDDPDDEDEVERLDGEVARSRARQQALQRLAALLESPLPEAAARETAL